MKNFFKQIRASVYNPSYYQELVGTETGGQAVKYYLKLSALLALLGTIIISAIFIPIVVPFVRIGGDKVLQYYPADLEIKIKSGQASINQTEPYFYPLPFGDDKDDKTKQKELKNLLVVDTKTSFSPEQFEKYQTVALLKRDAIYYLNNQQISLQPLSKIPDVTINHALLASWVGKALPMIKMAIPFLVPAIFIALFGILAFELIYLFFAAFFVWLLAKVAKWKLTYWQGYRVSAHAITLPILLYSIFFPLRALLPTFVFTLILLVIVWLNLRDQTSSLSENKV